MKKSIGRIIIIVFILGVTYFMAAITPYLLADYQYEKLISYEELTKYEVESILFLYDKKQISIEESLWGNCTILKDGQEFWQYAILGEPIDIVFDSNGKVVRVFSSFE